MKMKATETFEQIAREFFLYKWKVLAAWGGSRSGKTYGFLQVLILYLLQQDNKSVTVWRRTRATCKQTVMKDFIRILRSYPGLWQKFTYDKTHSIFTCKFTGSTIQFEGADEEDKVHGSQQDISYFNEITGMQESVYLQIAQRTNDFILADYNPSKHFWFDSKALDKRNKFVHSTYLGNSECPVNIVERLNAYKPIDKSKIGEVAAEQLALISDAKSASKFIASLINNLDDYYDLFLSWNNVRNKTANQYMYDVYCLGKKSERPEKIYNGWQKITLNEYLKIPHVEYNGLDIGTSSPSAMVGVKTDGKNFFIRKKLYAPSKTESGIVSQLNKLVAKGMLSKNDMIVVDSAKLAYVSTLQLNGYGFTLPAVKGAGSLESGIETMQSVNIFYVDDEDIEKEYDEYSYHLDKDGVPNDKPIQKYDHLMDAIRYIITYLIPYLNIKVGRIQ